MKTELVRRESIQELCGHRDHAIEAVGQFYDDYRALMLAINRSGPSGRFSMPEFYRGSPYIRMPETRETFVQQMTKGIDRKVWTHLMAVGQFETIMDRTERERFRKQLEEDPPPATTENCLATFTQLIGQSRQIFLRGIATAFSSLDRRFRTHDGFKIGTKVILTYFANDGHISYGRGTDETIRDIERTFYTLDALDAKANPEKASAEDEPKTTIPDRAHSIVTKAGAAMSWSNPTCDVSDKYFRIKVFKNGNAHLWFKRDDLVRKVNLLLAEYYGETLGKGADAAKYDYVHENRQGLAKNLGFFWTPKSVAERVIERAELWRTDEETPLNILEPSAGNGALIRAILTARTDVAPKITAVEYEAGRVHVLKVGFPGITVIQDDFLEIYPGRYDRIIMNPPFDGGRDIDHVLHALKLLAPGGILVAIMSAGTEWREDKRTVAFREFIKPFAVTHRWDGNMFEDLPAGSFKESGTMVNTVILKLRKPS